MSCIDHEMYAACHGVIHTASAAAAATGAGLAQLPCSDNAVITPIQLTMTIALGRVFGIELTESAAKATMISMAGASVGRTISQVLVGWIPGFGNAVNAVIAAGVTETLGWLLAEDFARQTTCGCTRG